jgi:exodeoxyribonuclease VII small subunit
MSDPAEPGASTDGSLGASTGGAAGGGGGDGDRSGAVDTPMSYEAAAARVEEIIRRLDSGEASLNETLALVSEGKTLIELCAAELTAVGDALEELRLDELVSRLESEAGA